MTRFRAMVVLATVMFSAFASGCSDGSDQGVETPGAASLGLDATQTTGVLLGIVTDLALRPIVGVTVEVQGTGTSTVTDAGGRFGFEGLPPAIYVVDASKAGWNATRAAIEVKADVADPDPLLLQMSPDPSTAPYVLYARSLLNLNAAVYAHGSTFTAGGFTNGTFRAAFDLAPGATWFQNELAWEAQTALADDVELFCGIYVDGASEYTATNVTIGKSPITVTLAVPADAGVDRAECVARLDDADGLAGAAADQRLELFTSTFHHMVPDAGWTLIGEGEHPPPA